MGIEGLDYQVVPVDFTGGIDTRTNRKLKVPGKWDTLVNCTHSLDTSLAKRDGVVSLVPETIGHGLATFDAELLAINGDAVRSVTVFPTPDQGVQVPGQLGHLHVDKHEVVRASKAHDNVDCAYHPSGVEVYVWVEHPVGAPIGFGVYFTVVDAVTRVTTVRPTLLSASGTSPRVVEASGAFYLFWSEGAGPNIWAAIYIPAYGLGPVTNLIGPIGLVAGTFPGLDAVGFGEDVGMGVFTAAVSYVFKDGTTSVRCSQVSYNPGTLVPYVMSTANLVSEAQQPNADICGIGCAVSGGITGLGAYVSTVIASPASASTMSGVAGASVNETWGVSLATQLDATPPFGAVQPTHVACTRYPVAGVTGFAAYVDGFADDGLGGGAFMYPLNAYFVSPGAPGNPMVLTHSRQLIGSNSSNRVDVPQGPFIAAKPFVFGSSVGGLAAPNVIALPVYMAHGATARVIQTGLWLVDGYSGAVLGQALYGGAEGHVNGCQVPSTPPVGIAVFQRSDRQKVLVPVLESGRLSLTNGSNTTPSGVSVLQVYANTPMPPLDAGVTAPSRVQLGRTTFVSDGMLSMYDGFGVSESDFLLFPEGIGVTRAAGGGTWPAGTYAFSAVYEWIDGQGQRHQSAPSPVVSVAITLNDTVTLRVPTLQLTQRTNVLHVLFATQANGTTFTRFGAIVNNDKTAAESVTVLLAGPPSGNELLYSQPLASGTTLPNDAPGPCSALGVHQQRLWIDLNDQPGAYRYSQQLVDGVGLQFTETFGGRLPVEAGSIKAFVSMDDFLVILAERKLFRITGSGPAPSGAFNGYSDPVEIPSDVGCSDAASVLSMPTGVMFRSTKGWYVLTRDLSIKYIGGPVKRYDSDTVTSTVLMGDRQEVRISSSQTYAPGYNGALQLCYSYVTDTWSVFQVTSLTRDGGPFFINSLQVWDAVWWPTISRYVSIGYYDAINQDTPGVYLDQPGINATPFAISMSARSSFLHLSGLEGYQRVRWLYLTLSAPTGAVASNLSWRVDYDDLYITQNPPGAPGCYSTTPVLLSGIAFGNSAAIDLRHKLRRQKCKSVAITINESPTSAGAPGVTGFQSLALQIGIKRGTNKLPAAQGVG